MDSKWSNLKNAIQEIQKKENLSQLSFEQLYSNAYNMVKDRNEDRLYGGLREVVKQHLKENVLQQVLNSLHYNFLPKLLEIWTDHQTSMAMIRDILMYMDQYFAKEGKVESVCNLGLILFRDEILRHSTIQMTLRRTLLDIVMDDRTGGETIGYLAVKSACQMLMALGVNSRSVYEEEFEKHFLEQSTLFYKSEAQKFLALNSASVYLENVESRTREESDRAAFYLEKDTGPRIVKIVEDEMIKNHMRTIVQMTDSGIGYMINNSKTEDLACIYRLFSRFPNEGIKVIVDTISAYIREQGQMFVAEDQNDNKNCVLIMQKVVELKDRFDHFLKNAFNNDNQLKPVILLGFERLLNSNSKSAEYLSLYIDDNLRKAGTMTEHETEEILDKIMFWFKLLAERDVFERYYKHHLAKRLLLNKSVSDDLEKNMISKFKSECGHDFTSKFESMFSDMSTSNTTNGEFEEYINNHNTNLSIEFSCRILNSALWPIPIPKTRCNIPVVPRETYDIFLGFYVNKNSRRKLTLLPQLGSACVDAKLGGRKYSLTVTTYQMCVLMLFNKDEVMTFEEISQETNIPDGDLQRALQSLSMGKLSQRILVRNSKTKSKDILPTDEFLVNGTFVSKLNRIKIHTVLAKADTEPERKEIRSRVDENRNHEVDAAIVRIMKSRKHLSQNLLVSDVTTLLKSRFLPSPSLIKSRIKVLIEKEYLAPSSEDSKVYDYLA